MKAPMMLHWVASKAGISEELALKLWRRAAGEAEMLVGNCKSPDYHRVAVEHFLALAEDECVQATPDGPCNLVPEPRVTWMWHHQDAMSRLSMVAGQRAYRQWQEAWQHYLFRKAA